MKLIIEVELGNDAMQSAEQTASAIMRSLLGQASTFLSPLNANEVGTVRDTNGNTVGKWEVIDDDSRLTRREI